MVTEFMRSDSEKGLKRRMEILLLAARAMEKNPHFRLSDASGAVGMRKSIFHYYFKDKKDIIYAVCREVPRTPALFMSLLALALEDSNLREELITELAEQVDAIGVQMTAQAIGQQVMSVLGVSAAKAAE